MTSAGAFLSSFVNNLIAFVLMIILAIVSFFFTVFVVDAGASIAGLQPDGNFVVLSAALLVAAAIVAGGVTPWSAMSGIPESERAPAATE